MAGSRLPFAFVLAWLAGCSSSPQAGSVRSEVAVVTLALPAPSSEEDAGPALRAPWKVGVFVSLTGGADAFGVDTKDGIELAFDEVNAAGGAGGRKVSVVYEDDRSSTREAARKVLQLIERDKVVAVIGEVISSRSRAGGAVANDHGVPLIATAATHSDVTQVGPFVFRACFDDVAQARAAARFMVRDSGKKRLGVLRMSDDASSVALTHAFDAEVARLGGQIVDEEVFSRADTDLTVQLRELSRRKPDLIYAPVYWDTILHIVQQGPAFGLHGDAFVGTDGWYGPDLLRDVGDALEGARFTDHWAPDAPWPVTRAFDEHFQARYRREPTSLAALGYDAARVVASALGRARDDSPEAVREALQATHGVSGATGTIASFGADREPDKEVVIVRIAGKALHYQTAIRSGP